MRISAEEFRQQVSGRPNKYGNRKIEIDGTVFDSVGEGRYWQVLRLRERTGEIYGLERQKVYKLAINDQPICKLIVDFAFYDKTDNQFHAQDWKGVVTPIFRLKAKMVKAQYGVTVEIVKK